MRLIDADAVTPKIDEEIKDIVIPKCPYAERKNSEYEIGFNNGLTIAKAIVLSAPTIEAEPVRHGKWLYSSDAEPVYRICNQCGSSYKVRKEETFNLCPSCGAKMDWKEEANE